ncbi:MAG: 1-phosphofructokinase [Melioribacteraceae bacterium]|nr:1-phosphofructokinase [Melioribacteraceae bacterium]MCF8355057.1 1-phosphofructokinase [Melioribacteraceae bacterium]MCF8395646.1 1-phosphofructokinase [Melioribacteraceae bacterium]MCF8420275.1 1-phosphofructokinase [Melioribacteraceae bacterium]
MVLTVTLNPLLEKRLHFPCIKTGQVNRSSKVEYKSGGKGINVSRQLNTLGISNHALTFLGGLNGKSLRHILTEEKIEHVIVSTHDETRWGCLILEDSENRITSYFSPNSEITQRESDEFKSKLEKMIPNYSAIIFAGSSPSKFTDDIFPFGIEIANQHDKITVLDTYGEHLKACIEKAPMVIHNNIGEVEKSLQLELFNEKKRIKYLEYLYNKGVKLGFLTNGRESFYASKFDFHYKVTPPDVSVIDATGSGDAFTAGIIYGMENAMVFDEFVKTAVSLGAANAAKWDVCNSSEEEMRMFYDSVIIEPVGKKMKIIDDSPNY